MPRVRIFTLASLRVTNLMYVAVAGLCNEMLLFFRAEYLLCSQKTLDVWVCETNQLTYYCYLSLALSGFNNCQD